MNKQTALRYYKETMYTVNAAFYDLCGQRPPAFMTEIPCTDDSVQKGLCGERLPAKHDQ